MALVVEDGTGVAGADSYAAVATANAYWANRPQDANAALWTAAAAVAGKQDGALREASAYLDATWGTLYRGVRLTATQGLLWPRIDRSALALTDTLSTVALLEAEQVLTDLPLLGADGLPMAALPAQIVTATIELAARATAARLAADKTEQGWLKRRKVGPLEREWGGPGIQGGSYGFVDVLLGPVIIGFRYASWLWR
jgi:hypothetical protein